MSGLLPKHFAKTIYFTIHSDLFSGILSTWTPEEIILMCVMYVVGPGSAAVGSVLGEAVPWASLEKGSGIRKECIGHLEKVKGRGLRRRQGGCESVLLLAV